MIPVYICEGDYQIRRFIKEKVQQYIYETYAQMEICYCESNVEKLLVKMEALPQQGLYFLGQMSTYSWWEDSYLWNLVREYDARGFIVCIIDQDFDMKKVFSHRVEALDYLYKERSQATEEKIKRCLQTVGDRYNLEINQSYKKTN